MTLVLVRLVAAAYLDPLAQGWMPPTYPRSCPPSNPPYPTGHWPSISVYCLFNSWSLPSKRAGLEMIRIGEKIYALNPSPTPQSNPVNIERIAFIQHVSRVSRTPIHWPISSSIAFIFPSPQSQREGRPLPCMWMRMSPVFFFSPACYHKVAINCLLQDKP